MITIKALIKGRQSVSRFSHVKKGVMAFVVSLFCQLLWDLTASMRCWESCELESIWNVCNGGMDVSFPWVLGRAQREVCIACVSLPSQALGAPTEPLWGIGSKGCAARGSPPFFFLLTQFGREPSSRGCSEPSGRVCSGQDLCTGV